MAAQTQVLGTFELLENILLHLPLRDLLLSQRINKECYDVVQKSTVIHRALWWKASAGLVQGEFHCKYEPDDEFEFGKFVFIDKSRERVGVPLLNPFIQPRLLEERPIGWAARDLVEDDSLVFWGDAHGKCVMRVACYPEQPGSPRRKTNSLAKMQLAHPPLGMLKILEDLDDEDEDETEFTHWEMGVTHGQLHQSCASDSRRALQEAGLEVPGGQSKTMEVQAVLKKIAGAHKWMTVDGTVDSITGHQMLAELSKDTKYAERTRLRAAGTFQECGKIGSGRPNEGGFEGRDSALASNGFVDHDQDAEGKASISHKDTDSEGFDQEYWGEISLRTSREDGWHSEAHVARRRAEIAKLREWSRRLSLKPLQQADDKE